MADKTSYKQEFMESIENSTSNDSVNTLKRLQKNLGIDDIEILSSGTLLYNKINDLSKVFKSSDVELFYDSDKKNSSTLVGNAVLNDLLDKHLAAVDKMKECYEMFSASSDKMLKRMELQNSNPVFRTFSRIRSLFVRNQQISLKEAEKQALFDKLVEYKDLNDKIYNYDLEDNMVGALVKEMTEPTQIGNHVKQHRYSKEEVPELLEETVVPELEKLGLRHLVPQLKESLDKEYGKNSSEITESDIPQKPEKSHEVLEASSQSKAPSWDLSHWGMSKEQFNEQATIAPHEDKQPAPIKEADSLER